MLDPERCWKGAGPCIRKMAPKSRAGARSRHWLCFVRAAGGEVDAAPAGGKVNKGRCACFLRGGRDVPDRRAFFAAAHCAAR